MYSFLSWVKRLAAFLVATRESSLVALGTSAAGPVLSLCKGDQCEVHVLSETPLRLCYEEDQLPSKWLRPLVRLGMKFSVSYDDVDSPQQWQDKCGLPGGCFFIKELPEGVHAMRAEWEQRYDAWVIAKLLLGLWFLWFWQPLSESITVHATLGSVGSLFIISSVVIYWFTKEVRGSIHGTVPFGRTLTSVSMFIFAFVPALRDAILVRIMPTSTDLASLFSYRDPFFDLPVLLILSVVAIFVAVCGASYGASMGMSVFASYPDPIGEVLFRIGSDGRRIDLLAPTPWPQWLLSVSIWLVGFLLLLMSTHVDSASAALTVLAVFYENIAHMLGAQAMAIGSSLTPRDLRPLISRAAYEMEARTCTADAVAALRRQLQLQPHLVRCVREDSELRLRRFQEGGADCPAAAELFDTPQGRWCCIL